MQRILQQTLALDQAALWCWDGRTAAANFPDVPGLNCVHQNLPYIQVLTVQRERQEVVDSGPSAIGSRSAKAVIVLMERIGRLQTDMPPDMRPSHQRTIMRRQDPTSD